MTFDENASIRYLMKEMDPSEEVIFEQQMMEDDDLLIEVECLRKVNRRLEELPEVSPPEGLTDQIVNKVAAKRERNSRRSQMKYFYLSAAASIVGVLFAGTFLLTLEEAGNGESQTAESADQVQQAATTGNSGLVDLDYSTLPTSSDSGVSPWVDNNEVLHFEGDVNESHTSSFDSIFRNSYQKLELVQPPSNRSASRTPDLHLTGSSPN
ncbi:MAG: hypothetical protein WD035_05185 [Balneolaceae bacterium]